VSDGLFAYGENRAMPVAWKVIETKGAIGFNIQEALLNQVKKMIGQEYDVLLMED